MIKEYLKKNYFLYLFVFLVFIAGSFSGFLALRTLEPEQEAQLTNYLDFFLSDYRETTHFDKSLSLSEVAVSNLLLLGVMWFMGLVIAGIPIVILMLFFRGFVFGFTVGFLIRSMHLYGILFSLVSVIPHNLLFIPALLITSVCAVRYAMSMVNRNILMQRGISRIIISYTAQGLFCCILILVGGAVKAFISPQLIQIYSRYLAQNAGVWFSFLN